MRRSRTLIIVAALGVGLAGCGSSHPKSASQAGAGGTTTAGGANATPSARCQAVSPPAPRGPQHLPKPHLRLNPARAYTVRMTTSCGEIDLRLDPKRAPKTSASFAYLVRRGFYDGLTFHRVVPGFVIQGGDPLGNGSGGPGYQVVEKPPANLRYTHGVVAMAKTQTEPSGASGSQFFIVSGTDAMLPPDYALVGQVVSGDAVIAAIDALGTPNGPPQQPVVMEKVTLQQR